MSATHFEMKYDFTQQGSWPLEEACPYEAVGGLLTQAN